MNSRGKILVILVAVVLILSCLPVGMAFASTMYNVTYIASVSSGKTSSIGSLTISMDAATYTAMTGQTLDLDLPTGFVLDIGKPSIFGPIGTPIATVTNDVYNNPGMSSLYLNSEGSIVIPGITTTITLPLTITVPSGTTGNITLNEQASGGSLFPNGAVVIAQVSTPGLTLAVPSAPYIDGSGGPVGTISITEDSADSLVDSGGPALKLTLPQGMTWNQSSINFSFVWGSTLDLTTSLADNGQESDISNTVPSTSGSFYELNASVLIDPSVPVHGQVTVQVSGVPNINVSSLVIADYVASSAGNNSMYSSSSSMYSMTNIYSVTPGQTSSIGDLEISMDAADYAAMTGQTLDLDLPVLPSGFVLDIGNPSISGVTGAPTATVTNDVNDNPGVSSFYLNAEGSTVASGVTTVTIGLPLTITVPGGATGNITLSIQAFGSSPFPNACLIIAQAPAPSQGLMLSAAYSTPTINANGGPVGTIAISENTQGSLVDSGGPAVKLTLPPGMTWNQPSINFTFMWGSALSLTTSLADNGQELDISNTVPSTSPTYYNLNASVVINPSVAVAGPVTVQVAGTATSNVSSLVIANYVSSGSAPVTPLTPAQQTQTTPTIIQLAIGSTNYSVNGKVYSMDVAAEIDNNRTFLPIRYIAASLGASDNWDATDQKATISFNGKTIELWIGKSTALVNGVKTPIDSANPDVAAAVVPPGRTMLPLRFIAESLGCQVGWDQSHQMITVTYPGS